MEKSRKKLYRQISDAVGNVIYTYSAHWIIVNRLKKRQTRIKVMQIILTALSTGGFLASIIAGIPCLSWLGGLTSAVALALNLYSLNFNLPADIKSHTDAANALWEVRELYKSLIVDFEDLTNEEIRTQRDRITQIISQINKQYPGTDSKAFSEAQKNLKNYMFEDEESAKLLNLEDIDEESANN